MQVERGTVVENLKFNTEVLFLSISILCTSHGQIPRINLDSLVVTEAVKHQCWFVVLQPNIKDDDVHK